MINKTTISQNIWDDAPVYTPAIWGVESSCRNMGAEWVNPAWSGAEVATYWIAYWSFQKEASEDFEAMCADNRYDEAVMAVAAGDWQCPESDQSVRAGLCKSCGEEVTITCAGMTHGDQELYTCSACGREDMNGDDCRLQGLEEEDIEVW